MKFRGHETFYIRKGWLYKGLRNVIEKPDIFVDSSVNPMDILGIGANMVKSLRYWLVSCGLTEESTRGKHVQKLTKLGEIIYKNDPYMEEIGTWWLIHYKLANNINNATSWYVFFNEFEQLEFDNEDFKNSLIKYIRMGEESLPSNRALDEDFNCIINTYVPRLKLRPEKVNPEDNMDCPLGELGLVDVLDKGKKVFKKNIPHIATIPILIVLAIVIEQSNGKKELKISSLQYDKCGVGKVFNLDSITVISILNKLEKLGYIKVVRTAGLDVIKILTDMDSFSCVKVYYEELNN